MQLIVYIYDPSVNVALWESLRNLICMTFPQVDSLDQWSIPLYNPLSWDFLKNMYAQEVYEFNASYFVILK